ncbi:MAG: hypothetical protein IME93_07820 [Proteobacteria bacterium]|nr:hypothetical protein [Pseudomonadota bacterium]
MTKNNMALVTTILLIASTSVWAEKAQQTHEEINFKSTENALRANIASQQQGQIQSKSTQTMADKKTTTGPILSVLKVNGI